MDLNLKLTTGQKLTTRRPGMVRPDEVTLKLRRKTNLHYFSVLTAEGYGATVDYKQGETFDDFFARQVRMHESAKTTTGMDRIRAILIQALREEATHPAVTA